MIRFSDVKNIPASELEKLFQSVGWLSANYPQKLEIAIMNSATVFSAWDGDLLVGLINALDDGALTAYAHYLLVRPEYQGHGIGKALVGMLKEKYAGYLYLLLLVEEKEKVGFYEKLGFGVIEGTTPVYIMNT